MDTSSLTALREKAYRTESNIRDLLMLVPESLRKNVYEFSTSHKLRYAGTVPAKIETGHHPYTEWQANLELRQGVWNSLQYGNAVQILFRISYFGGGMHYRPAEGTASYINIQKPFEGNSSTYIVSEPEKIFSGLPKYFPEDVTTTLCEQISLTIPSFESVLQNFIYRETQDILGSDAWYLLLQAYTWQQAQKEYMKIERTYLDLIQEARKELPEIIEGLRSSKSFSKSLIFKGLRERTEKILERLSLITTPEFWAEVNKK